MKALIIIREESCHWLRTCFPDDPPVQVRICNKPWLEFLVDFCVLQSCEAIRVVMEEPDIRVESYYQPGDLWGIPISFSAAFPGDTQDQILAKNQGFCGSSPLWVMEGFFFIGYGTDSCLECEGGRIRMVAASGDTGSYPDGLTLRPLQSLRDLFAITRDILEQGHSRYVLPGYGTEKGVTLGSNVEIHPGTRIVPPVILGSNVRLMGHAVIGPYSVIGSDVIIDTDTTVSNSIIMPGTYVGKHLQVSEKIIHGPIVISREGEKLMVTDAFLLTTMARTRRTSLFRTGYSAMIALALAACQALPFLCFALIRRVQHGWHTEPRTFFMDVQGTTRTFSLIRYVPDRMTGRIFRALCLDKFCFYKAVLSGNLAIIGNHLLTATAENQKLISDFPDYSPGVFSFTEGEGLDADSPESEIAERFHGANRSFFMDVRMLLRALVHRILS